MIAVVCSIGVTFPRLSLGELHVLMTQIKANQSPSGDRVSSAPKTAFYLKISLFPISD